MKFQATVKALCLLAGIAVTLYGVEAKGCPSECEHGTTTVLQRVRKSCNKFWFLKSKCTEYASVCVCASTSATTAKTSTTTMKTSSPTEKPTTRRKVITTRPSATMETMTTRPSATMETMTTRPSATMETMPTIKIKTGTIKTPNADALSVICNKRSENEFFFSHPTDATKYVQCGAFGSAYEMSCSHLTIWNNDVKACVSKQFL